MARLPVILSIAAAGLGLAVLYQFAAPVAPVAADAAVPAETIAVAAPLLTRFEPPPESAFAAINARPLFDPARQPVDAPAPAGTQSATPPDVTLVGVAIGGGNAVALLQRPNVTAALSVRAGDSIDGWQVKTIAADRVVLEGAGTSFEVKMRAAAGLPQPRLAAPAPADQTGQQQ